MAGAHPADRPARHPDPRSANFPQPGPLLLRAGPWAVLVGVYGGAGGNAQMEIELAMEILQVAVTVDEARQNRLALDVDNLGVIRNGDFPAPADRPEPPCMDDDHGIFHGRPPGAVDQSSAQHDECFLWHVWFSFPVRTIGRLQAAKQSLNPFPGSSGCERGLTVPSINGSTPAPLCGD